MAVYPCIFSVYASNQRIETEVASNHEGEGQCTAQSFKGQEPTKSKEDDY